MNTQIFAHEQGWANYVQSKTWVDFNIPSYTYVNIKDI